MTRAKGGNVQLLQSYEQTAQFDPNNPNQRSRIIWTNEGYNSFYFNQIPNDSTLGRLRGPGLGSFSTLPSFAQIGIVGAVAAVIGYLGMSKFGDSYVKPGLKKIGINLSGPRRSRRRR